MKRWLALFMAGALSVFACYEVDRMVHPVQSVSAQQYQFTAPDCKFGFTFAVVGGVITPQTNLGGTRIPSSQDASTLAGYDNRFQNCTSWTLMYQSQGVGALSIELDQAPDSAGIPGSWVAWTNPAAGVVFPMTILTTSQASAFTYQPWVSVILNSATGTGTVSGQVIGWRPQSGQDASALGNSVTLAGFNYRHISAATNTQIKATGAFLHTINLNSGTTGTATVVDTSAANCSGGTTIAVIALSATVVGNSLTFDVATTNGLCVTTSAASDITVSSR